MVPVGNMGNRKEKKKQRNKLVKKCRVSNKNLKGRIKYKFSPS